MPFNQKWIIPLGWFFFFSWFPFILVNYPNKFSKRWINLHWNIWHGSSVSKKHATDHDTGHRSRWKCFWFCCFSVVFLRKHTRWISLTIVLLFYVLECLKMCLETTFFRAGVPLLSPIVWLNFIKKKKKLNNKNTSVCSLRCPCDMFV